MTEPMNMTPPADLPSSDELREVARKVNRVRPGVAANEAMAVIESLLVMGWRPPEAICPSRCHDDQIKAKETVGGDDPMSGPAISDEMVAELAQVMRDVNLPEVWNPQLPHFIPMDTFARAALERLVACGWRPEADVLREAAEEIRGADSFNYGDEDPEDWQAIVAAHLEMRADIRERYPVTALEPVGALPVAGSFGAVVHEQGGLKGTSKDEGQERSEEQRHG